MKLLYVLLWVLLYKLSSDLLLFYRQRAIKALNERLNKLEQPQSSQWPSMEDDESTPSQPLPEGSPEAVELESVAVETKPTKESDDETALTTTDQAS